MCGCKKTRTNRRGPTLKPVQKSNSNTNFTQPMSNTQLRMLAIKQQGNQTMNGEKRRIETLRRLAARKSLGK